MKKTKAVWSKWIKANILKNHKELRKYVPPTQRLTKQSLSSMLLQYNTVFVKPEVGALGKGVIQVKRIGSSGNKSREAKANKRAYASGTKSSRSFSRVMYRVHEDAFISFFRSMDSLFQHLKKRAGGRNYIVQKGIPLIRRQNKPVDLRIVVQKNEKREWEVTGMIARIAHPKKVITNGSSGGTVLPIEKLLAERCTVEQRKSLMAKLKRIGLMTARTIGKSFPSQFEAGLDVAITPNHNLWILEVNSKPDPRPFVKLKDKRQLRTIVKYGKRYGRKYNLIPKYKQKPV